MTEAVHPITAKYQVKPGYIGSLYWECCDEASRGSGDNDGPLTEQFATPEDECTLIGTLFSRTNRRESVEYAASSEIRAFTAYSRYVAPRIEYDIIVAERNVLDKTDGSKRKLRSDTDVQQASDNVTSDGQESRAKWSKRASCSRSASGAGSLITYRTITPSP